jgi:hypothetical protein
MKTSETQCTVIPELTQLLLYFSYIVVVIVLLVEETGVPGWRKPLICHKSMTNLGIRNSDKIY